MRKYKIETSYENENGDPIVETFEADRFDVKDNLSLFFLVRQQSGRYAPMKAYHPDQWRTCEQITNT